MKAPQLRGFRVSEEPQNRPKNALGQGEVKVRSIPALETGLPVHLRSPPKSQAKMVEEEDWRSLCRGHLDGSIFDTAKPDRQVPFRVGPLLVDPPGRRVEVHGREVRLLAREFEVVALLATEPDRVFTKQDLKRELWGDRGSFRTIDSHISRARCKLREGGADGLLVNCHATATSCGTGRRGRPKRAGWQMLDHPSRWVTPACSTATELPGLNVNVARFDPRRNAAGFPWLGVVTRAIGARRWIEAVSRDPSDSWRASVTRR